MQAGHQDPDEAEQPDHDKRVIEPQPATYIDKHRTDVRGTGVRLQVGRAAQTHIDRSRWLLVLAGLAVGVTLSACLPNPQLTQSARLYEQLTLARTVFISATPTSVDSACNTVGDVQTRLVGEPGLANLQPLYSSLRSAAAALQAVCGQSTVLDQAGGDTVALSAARDRWRAGIQRELRVACDHLQYAAATLGRPAPC